MATIACFPQTTALEPSPRVMDYPPIASVDVDRVGVWISARTARLFVALYVAAMLALYAATSVLKDTLCLPWAYL